MVKILSAALLYVSTTFCMADWVIVQKTTMAGSETPMTIKVKGAKSRMDMGKEMSVLFDTPSGQALILLHAQKAMMRMDAEKIKAAMSTAAGKAGIPSEPIAPPTATGQTEKFGEHNCEVYTWTGKIGTGKFWIAKDFPKAKELNELTDKMSQALANPLVNTMPKSADFPGMAIKSEVEMMGQKIVTELVSAKEEPLSDEDFKSPSGYKEISVPGQ